jgi:LysR family transcriptional regulator, low CO2-responsive transcriptional regulator
VINLNQLRIFYCVAKNLSFTRAAKDLFISQPAVTAQMKLFEGVCELKFFKKKGRGICLTDEGKALYSHARKIFEYEKELESVIDELKNLKQGVLRIGTTKTYARYFMPFLVRGFKKHYPKIKVYLDEGSSLDMIHSLLELKNEIAIITKVEEQPDIEFRLFSLEKVILILSRRHPLATAPSVSIEQLAQEPIIMRESGSGTRKFIDDLFEKHQYTPNILMETSNTEFIKQLVERGDGVSFLVKESVAVELRGKKLATIPIEGEDIFLDTNIAYLKKQPLSLSGQAFLQALEKLAEGERPIEGVASLLSKKK